MFGRWQVAVESVRTPHVSKEPRTLTNLNSVLSTDPTKHRKRRLTTPLSAHKGGGRNISEYRPKPAFNLWIGFQFYLLTPYLIDTILRQYMNTCSTIHTLRLYLN